MTDSKDTTVDISKFNEKDIPEMTDSKDTTDDISKCNVKDITEMTDSKDTTVDISKFNEKDIPEMTDSKDTTVDISKCKVKDIPEMTDSKGHEIKFIFPRVKEQQVRHRNVNVEPVTLQSMLTKGRGNQFARLVTEISSFTHGTEYIQCIKLLSDSEALIHSNKSTTIDRVNLDGQQINDIMIGKDFDDFIVVNKDHVYTLFVTKMIRRVSPSGCTSDVTSTAPLRPAGICAAHAGGLLVCLCSSFTKQINTDSFGEVHHLDINGKLQKIYPKFGDSRTKLFTHPIRIVQNTNLDLCVVDIIASDFTSRLVVVAVDGKMRFEYKGHRSLRRRFYCFDVVCDTKRSLIILSDFYNHAVHLLTSVGCFMRLLFIKDSELRYPRSLAMRDDKLWVGCGHGSIKVYKINL